MNTFLLETLIERLSNTNVIVGLIIAAIGLAMSFMARRVAIVVRKNDNIPPEDKIYLGIKAFGLVMILVALIILIIE